MIVYRPPSLDHLETITDDVGILQHAAFDVPKRSEGYCTDDVARAFMVALAASEFPALADRATRLARIYLAFLADAQRPDGRFRNFMSYARTWLDDVGSEDSNGRAIWALGYGMRHARRAEWRALCGTLLERSLPIARALAPVRSRAYAALGLVRAREVASGEAARTIDATLDLFASDLHGRRDACASGDWNWFEPELTYDNARLSEALLRIGLLRGRRADVELGLATLDFYASVVVEDGVLVPIGNDGWYRRGGVRARFGQQPLEASALVDAAHAALAAGGGARYETLAACARDWFFGQNTARIPLAVGGGCRDGLERSGANENMGAESTLAYLSVAFARARPDAETIRVAR